MACLKPLNSTIGEIKRMYVRPEYRRQGLGKLLLEELLVVLCFAYLACPLATSNRHQA